MARMALMAPRREQEQRNAPRALFTGYAPSDLQWAILNRVYEWPPPLVGRTLGRSGSETFNLDECAFARAALITTDLNTSNRHQLRGKAAPRRTDTQKQLRSSDKARPLIAI